MTKESGKDRARRIMARLDEFDAAKIWLKFLQIHHQGAINFKETCKVNLP